MGALDLARERDALLFSRTETRSGQYAPRPRGETP